MCSIITAIIVITTVLFFISTGVFSRSVTIFFGAIGVITVIAFKFMEKLSTRRTTLMFGPIKEQMDSLKAKTRLEYPGVFTFVDMCGKGSLFKYTPLKSQQPPIAEYMIFYKNDLVTILTVYKPDIMNAYELHYDVESFGRISYMVLYKKALWLAVKK